MQRLASDFDQQYIEALIEEAIAYAASFGTDQWEYTEEQTARCKKLIQQFDLVTVREKAAVNLVTEKLNKDAEFVLDPTLLLSKEDYIELFVGKNLPDNKGIIPWDDDADVCMPRADYNRLIELSLHVPKPYSVQHFLTCKDFVYPFIKFIDTDTEVIEHFEGSSYKSGVWIDCTSPHN